MRSSCLPSTRTRVVAYLPPPLPAASRTESEAGNAAVAALKGMVTPLGTLAVTSQAGMRSSISLAVSCSPVCGSSPDQPA